MSDNKQPAKETRSYGEGELYSRPSNAVKSAARHGLHSLPLEKNREVLIYVPQSYRPEKPSAFALMLHGAGGNAEHGINLLRHLADETGIIIAAPKSQRATWDVIVSDYGVDVGFIDRALEYCFERYAVDSSRLAVGGFSDGASYALSLGITNGRLFSHIIAFSPGFMVSARQSGEPRIYISHGTEDRVLPIDRCSRRLAPQLKRAGYEVIYREFNGPHTIPPDIASESAQWLISPPAA
ncbi:MAG: phospholipase [Acidobacteriota bacterium]|nr:phospholipase [Acidobacteriota bacterium]